MLDWVWATAALLAHEDETGHRSVGEDREQFERVGGAYRLRALDVPDG